MALSQKSNPLRFGAVVHFTPDGRLHRTIFAEMAAFEMGDGMHATVTVIGPDGKPVPPGPPQPSDVQRWMAIADGDGLLDDAFIYFGKAVDWFDIWKTLECLILRFGEGSESVFLDLAWSQNLTLPYSKGLQIGLDMRDGSSIRPKNPCL